MTLEQLKDQLVAWGFEDSTVFDEPDYIDAVVGVSTDGCVIYSFNKMVEYLMATTDMGLIDATEYIEVNVIRTLPYMGEKHPIIMDDDNFEAFKEAIE